MKIFSGSSNPEFAKGVAKHIGTNLCDIHLSRFADGEVGVQIKENIRGQHVFVIQSTSPPVNENYMELFLILDSLKRASAEEITLVMPYYGYARQDRKTGSRMPISAKCMADMLSTAGISRLLVVDLHSPQIQGFFNVPVDNLYAVPTLADFWKKKNNGNNVVIISPDAGGAERARSLAKKIPNSSVAMIDKRRVKANEAKAVNIIGDVKGKEAIIIDDMVDTAGTLCEAAGKVLEAGALKVSTMASHALLSPPALERLEKSQISELISTDSIPLSEEAKKSKKIKIVSLTSLVAEAMKRISKKESISLLFN